MVDEDLDEELLSFVENVERSHAVAQARRKRLNRSSLCPTCGFGQMSGSRCGFCESPTALGQGESPEIRAMASGGEMQRVEIQDGFKPAAKIASIGVATQQSGKFDQNRFSQAKNGASSSSLSSTAGGHGFKGPANRPGGASPTSSSAASYAGTSAFFSKQKKSLGKQQMQLSRPKAHEQSESVILTRKSKSKSKKTGTSSPSSSAAASQLHANPWTKSRGAPDIDLSEDLVKKLPAKQLAYDEEAIKTWIYPQSDNYTERKYQFSMAKQALLKNSLICLPTGLGKTFIAAVVMYNMLRWFPTGKVVFLAPTKPLVSQQVEACHKIMGIPESMTTRLMGNIAPAERDRLWKEKRLFYCTPQTARNDCIKEVVPLDQIVCVVIDEAHRAVGNYSYVDFVRRVREVTSNFRILALSATPGKAKANVQDVINNLLIANIDYRSESDPDVKPYVFHKLIEVVVVRPNDFVQHIRSRILEFAKPLHRELCQNAHTPKMLARKLEDISKDLLQVARGKVFGPGTFNYDRSKMKVVEMITALCTIMTGLHHLETAGLGSMIDHYEKQANKAKPNSSLQPIISHPGWKAFMTECKSVKEDPSNNPKFSKLHDVLMEHFLRMQNGETQTSAIVFAQYRQTVAAICDLIKKKTSLRVSAFVGQKNNSKSKTKEGEEQNDDDDDDIPDQWADSVAMKGLPQKEQQKVIERFRGGELDVLVATCIAEEGLDIGSVDLIVCFDMLKSPVRMVQRFGRAGRKRAGAVKLLVSAGKEERDLKSGTKLSNSLHKLLGDSRNKLEMYQHNPRLIPYSVNPLAVRQTLQISEFRSSQVAGITPKKKEKKNIKSIRKRSKAWYDVVPELSEDESKYYESFVVTRSKVSLELHHLSKINEHYDWRLPTAVIGSREQCAQSVIDFGFAQVSGVVGESKDDVEIVDEVEKSNEMVARFNRKELEEDLNDTEIGDLFEDDELLGGQRRFAPKELDFDQMEADEDLIPNSHKVDASDSETAFHTQSTVTVRPLFGPNQDNEGGVGRVLRRNEIGTYDIKYIIDGRIERSVMRERIESGIKEETLCGFSAGKKKRTRSNVDDFMPLDAKNTGGVTTSTRRKRRLCNFPDYKEKSPETPSENDLLPYNPSSKRGKAKQVDDKGDADEEEGFAPPSTQPSPPQEQEEEEEFGEVQEEQVLIGPKVIAKNSVLQPSQQSEDWKAILAEAQSDETESFFDDLIPLPPKEFQSELSAISAPGGLKDLCSCCGIPGTVKGDVLLRCCGSSSCSVTAHAKCFGIRKGFEGEWHCDCCLEKIPQVWRNCFLCSRRDGALKKVNEHLWVHVCCAMSQDRVRLKIDADGFLEGIDVDALMKSEALKDFHRFTCSYCGRSVGLTKTCSRDSCGQRFHASCNLIHGVAPDSALCELHWKHNSPLRKPAERNVEIPKPVEFEMETSKPAVLEIDSDSELQSNNLETPLNRRRAPFNDASQEWFGTPTVRQRAIKKITAVEAQSMEDSLSNAAKRKSAEIEEDEEFETPPKPSRVVPGNLGNTALPERGSVGSYLPPSRGGTQSSDSQVTTEKKIRKRVRRPPLLSDCSEPKKSKKKTFPATRITAREAFLEDEAEVDESVSDDEEDKDEDGNLEGLINDSSQLSVETGGSVTSPQHMYARILNESPGLFERRFSKSMPMPTINEALAKMEGQSRRVQPKFKKKLKKAAFKCQKEGEIVLDGEEEGEENVINGKQDAEKVIRKPGRELSSQSSSNSSNSEIEQANATRIWMKSSASRKLISEVSRCLRRLPEVRLEKVRQINVKAVDFVLGSRTGVILLSQLRLLKLFSTKIGSLLPNGTDSLLDQILNDAFSLFSCVIVIVQKDESEGPDLQFRGDSKPFMDAYFHLQQWSDARSFLTSSVPETVSVLIQASKIEEKEGLDIRSLGLVPFESMSSGDLSSAKFLDSINGINLALANHFVSSKKYSIRDLLTCNSGKTIQNMLPGLSAKNTGQIMNFINMKIG